MQQLTTQDGNQKRSPLSYWENNPMSRESRKKAVTRSTSETQTTTSKFQKSTSTQLTPTGQNLKSEQSQRSHRPTGKPENKQAQTPASTTPLSSQTPACCQTKTSQPRRPSREAEGVTSHSHSPEAPCYPAPPSYQDSASHPSAGPDSIPAPTPFTVSKEERDKYYAALNKNLRILKFEQKSASEYEALFIKCEKMAKLINKLLGDNLCLKALQPLGWKGEPCECPRHY